MAFFLYDDTVFTYTDLKPFIILKKHRDEAEAKRLADIEYEKYIPMLRPYVKREIRHVLKEMYAPEGVIGYLIRIELQSKASPGSDELTWNMALIQNAALSLEEYKAILKEEEDGR